MFEIHRSSCPGKTPYPDRSEARNTMDRMRQRGKDRGKTLEVYRCEACGTWHIGNRAKERMKPK